MRRSNVGPLAAAIGIALALAACGGGTGGQGGADVPISRANGARTGVYPGPGVDHSPKVVWGFDGGSVPAVVGDALYVIGNRSVYALDMATGQQRWGFQTGGYGEPPTVVDGTVYVGAYDPYLYALDADTGEERWRFEMGGRAGSSPVVEGGVVYLGSSDGYLYAIDAENGDLRWRLAPGGDYSPAVADGVVYVRAFNGCLLAVDAETGEKLWESGEACHRAGEPGISTGPVVANGLVYIARPVGSSGTLNLCALEAKSGEELWCSKLDGNDLSSLAVTDDMLCVVSEDGFVHAFDALDGEPEWRFQVGRDIGSSPAVVGDAVYVGGSDGYLYRLDAATGVERWHFQMASVRSLVVAGGMIYASGDGGLYAIAEGEQAD